MNNKIISKKYLTIMKKSLAAFVAGVFLFNDIAFAADFQNLATPKGVLQPELQERFQGGYGLVSDERFNEFVRAAVGEAGGFENLTDVYDDRVFKAGKRINLKIVKLPNFPKEMGVPCRLFTGPDFGVPVIFTDKEHYCDEVLLRKEKRKISFTPSRKPKDQSENFKNPPAVFRNGKKTGIEIEQEESKPAIKARFPTAQFVTPKDEYAKALRFQELIKQLGSKSREARVNAAKELGGMGPEAADAIWELCNLVRRKDGYYDENDRGPSAEALEALIKIGPASIPHLIWHLNDPTNPDRKPFATALRQFGEAAKDAVPALKSIINHEGFFKENEWYRYTIFFTLVEVGKKDPDTMLLVIKFMQMDPDQRIRQSAIRHIRDTRGINSVEFFVNTAKEKPAHNKFIDSYEYRDAIAEFGFDAVPILLKLKDEDNNYETFILKCIERIAHNNQSILFKHICDNSFDDNAIYNIAIQCLLNWSASTLSSRWGDLRKLINSQRNTEYLAGKLRYFGEKFGERANGMWPGYLEFMLKTGSRDHPYSDDICGLARYVLDSNDLLAIGGDLVSIDEASGLKGDSVISRCLPMIIKRIDSAMEARELTPQSEDGQKLFEAEWTHHVTVMRAIGRHYNFLINDEWARESVFLMEADEVRENVCQLNEFLELWQEVNKKIVYEQRVDEHEFGRTHLPLIFRLELIFPGSIEHLTGLLKKSRLPKAIVRYLDAKKDALKDGKALSAFVAFIHRIRAAYRRKFKPDITAYSKILNYMSLIESMGYGDAAVDLLDNFEVANLKWTDVSSLPGRLMNELNQKVNEHFYAYLGINKKEVENVQSPVWLIFYTPFFTRINQAYEHIRVARYDKLERFRGLIKSTVLGNFWDYIENTDQVDLRGREIATHNKSVREQIVKNGVDDEKWLGKDPKCRMKPASFDYQAEKGNINNLVEDARDVITYIQRALTFGMTPYHDTLTGLLAKFGIKVIGDGLNPILVLDKDSDIRYPTIVAAVSELLEPLTTLAGVIADTAQSHNMPSNVIETLGHFKDSVELALKRKRIANLGEVLSQINTRSFTIRPILRKPEHDLFIGDFTSCCLAMNSNSYPDAMVDRLIDEGINVIEVIDESTGLTMAAAWLFLAEDGSLVIQNLEISSSYEIDNDLKNMIGIEIIQYAAKFAEYIGSRRLYIGQPGHGKYFGAGSLVRTLYKDKEVSFGLKKIGGYIGGLYYLDSAGKPSAYLAWDKASASTLPPAVGGRSLMPLSRRGWSEFGLLRNFLPRLFASFTFSAMPNDSSGMPEDKGTEPVSKQEKKGFTPPGKPSLPSIDKARYSIILGCLFQICAIVIYVNISAFIAILPAAVALSNFLCGAFIEFINHKDLLDQYKQWAGKEKSVRALHYYTNLFLVTEVLSKIALITLIELTSLVYLGGNKGVLFYYAIDAGLISFGLLSFSSGFKKEINRNIERISREKNNERRDRFSSGSPTVGPMMIAMTALPWLAKMWNTIRGTSRKSDEQQEAARQTNPAELEADRLIEPAAERKESKKVRRARLAEEKRLENEKKTQEAARAAEELHALRDINRKKEEAKYLKRRLKRELATQRERRDQLRARFEKAMTHRLDVARRVLADLEDRLVRVGEKLREKVEEARKREELTQQIQSRLAAAEQKLESAATTGDYQELIAEMEELLIHGLLGEEINALRELVIEGLRKKTEEEEAERIAELAKLAQTLLDELMKYDFKSMAKFDEAVTMNFADYFTDEERNEPAVVELITNARTEMELRTRPYEEKMREIREYLRNVRFMLNNKGFIDAKHCREVSAKLRACYEDAQEEEGLDEKIAELIVEVEGRAKMLGQRQIIKHINHIPLTQNQIRLIEEMSRLGFPQDMISAFETGFHAANSPLNEARQIQREMLDKVYTFPTTMNPVQGKFFERAFQVLSIMPAEPPDMNSGRRTRKGLIAPENPMVKDNRPRHNYLPERDRNGEDDLTGLHTRSAGTTSVSKTPASLPAKLETALSIVGGRFRGRDFKIEALRRKVTALLSYHGQFEKEVHAFVRKGMLAMAYSAGRKNPDSGRILGLAGEISGLYEVLIKRSSSLKYINMGRLESLDRVIHRKGETIKEFDALSDTTAFEFKFHLTLRKLYQQVIGMDTEHTSHLEVLTKDNRFKKIRNIIYFGEADDGQVVKAITKFIESRPSLKDRLLVTPEGGVSFRLTLQQAKDFLYSPQTIGCAREEERIHRRSFLPKNFPTADEEMDRLIAAKLKQLEKLEGEHFDVIISVSKASPEDLGRIRKIVPSEGSANKPENPNSLGSSAHSITAQVKANIVDQVNKMAEELGMDVSESPFKDMLESSECSLSKIAENLNAKKIDPNIRIRTNADDPPAAVSARPLNIGVYGLAANPIHWGHILAALGAMAECDLDKVVFVVHGKDSRKPILESTQEMRHEISRQTLSLFQPLFEYSSVSKDTEDDCEKAIFDILILNGSDKMKAYYLVGADHYRATAADGNPDTLPKLEINMQNPALGFDSDLHKLGVIFFERGPRGPPVPTTKFSKDDIIFRPPVPFEASSTSLREGNLALMPYRAYQLVRDDPKYDSLRILYGIKPRLPEDSAAAAVTAPRHEKYSHTDSNKFINLLEKHLARKLSESEQKEAARFIEAMSGIRKEVDVVGRLNKMLQGGIYPEVCVDASNRARLIMDRDFPDAQYTRVVKTEFYDSRRNMHNLFPYDGRIWEIWWGEIDRRSPYHEFLVIKFLGVPLILELSGDQFVMSKPDPENDWEYTDFVDQGVMIIPAAELQKDDVPYTGRICFVDDEKLSGLLEYNPNLVQLIKGRAPGAGIIDRPQDAAVKSFADFYPVLGENNAQTLTESRETYVTVDFAKPAYPGHVRLMLHSGDPASTGPWHNTEAEHINNYGQSQRFKVTVPTGDSEYTFRIFDGKNWYWMGWNVRVTAGKVPVAEASLGEGAAAAADVAKPVAEPYTPVPTMTLSEGGVTFTPNPDRNGRAPADELDKWQVGWYGGGKPHFASGNRDSAAPAVNAKEPPPEDSEELMSKYQKMATSIIKFYLARGLYFGSDIEDVRQEIFLGFCEAQEAGGPVDYKVLIKAGFSNASKYIASEKRLKCKRIIEEIVRSDSALESLGFDSFGDRLKQEIVRKNISIKKLAQKIHVYPTTVSRWISNRREPPPKMMNCLAKELEVSVSYLMTDLPLSVLLKIGIENETKPVFREIMAAKIKVLRYMQGLSNKELAAKIGASESAVSQWQRAESFPPPAFMKNLASALGVNTSLLIAGLEPKEVIRYKGKERLSRRQIGLRIKMKRYALGQEQKEYADDLGVNQATLSRWERGRIPLSGRALKDKNLKKIARILGLSVSEFISGMAFSMLMGKWVKNEHKRKYKKLFGNKIKVLRIIRGWSVEHCARRLNIHPNTYRKYEDGLMYPGMQIIRQMAKTFDVGVSELVAGAPIERLMEMKVVDERDIYYKRIIARKLKALRYESGLEQKDVSSRTGIKHQNISKWERAITFPGPAQLNAIAKGLNTTVSELIAGMPYRKLMDFRFDDIGANENQRITAGLQIKVNRIMRGLTPAELAAELRIRTNTLMLFESGRQPPNIYQAKILSRILGVRIRGYEPKALHEDSDAEARQNQANAVLKDTKPTVSLSSSTTLWGFPITIRENVGDVSKRDTPAAPRSARWADSTRPEDGFGGVSRHNYKPDASDPNVLPGDNGFSNPTGLVTRIIVSAAAGDLEGFITKGKVDSSEITYNAAVKWAEMFDKDLAVHGRRLAAGLSGTPIRISEDADLQSVTCDSIDGLRSIIFSSRSGDARELRFMFVNNNGRMVGYGAGMRRGKQWEIADFRFHIFQEYRKNGYGDLALKLIMRRLYHMEGFPRPTLFTFVFSALSPLGLNDAIESGLIQFLLKHGFRHIQDPKTEEAQALGFIMPSQEDVTVFIKQQPTESAPIDVLQDIRDHDALLEAATGGEGIVISEEAVTPLTNAGVIKPAVAAGKYVFTDMMIGPDRHHTENMINVATSVMTKFKQASDNFVKEMIRANMVDHIFSNIKSTKIAEKTQVIRIWQGYGANSQIGMMQEVARRTENGIKFESLEDLVSFAEDCRDGTVTILPRNKLSLEQRVRLDNKSGVRVVYVNLDKADIGTYELGNLEGLIGIGRSYLNDDEDSFYKLYNLLADKPVSERTPLAKLKANPIDFIDRLKFTLRPITAHDPNELPRINRELKKLLESA